MAKREKKKKLKTGGDIVFSTDPDFVFESNIENSEAPEPGRQNLRVKIDRKQRAGKTVTLVTGFNGSESGLKDLTKLLKSTCGVGGSSKGGDIIIQGSLVDKIIQVLQSKGYNARKG